MPTFDKILVPISLEDPTPASIEQAVALARHFHSEIVVLHAIRPLSYLRRDEEGRDSFLARALRDAQEHLENVAGLDGISVKRVVVNGDPGQAILETAKSEGAKLIVMGPRVYPGLFGALLGSVTESILNASEVPIWACANREEAPSELTVRSIVCGVDFTAHDAHTVGWAAAMAAEFQARLTLAHAAPGVEMYGPGGFHEIPELKKMLLDASGKRMAALLEETKVKADAFVGCGEVAAIMDQAVRHGEADLMVIGRRASAGMLGGNGYRIIRKAQIAVLAV